MIYPLTWESCRTIVNTNNIKKKYERPKKIQNILGGEILKILFIRNRSMHIERGRTQVFRRGIHFLFHYILRRVTSVTNLMCIHRAPFLITDFNMISTVIIIITFVVAVYVINVKTSSCQLQINL